MRLLNLLPFMLFWFIERIMTPVTFILNVRYEKGFRRGKISYRNIWKQTLVNRIFIWEDFKW